MLTLQNIKDTYYVRLASGEILMGFEEYLKTYYMPAYDDECNFLGYDTV